ncbi:hypothetical protein [Micromonospora sp. WMMD980]|uniref:hypothetical protein n=1 Tax=Micromonospora sp. WMMD980 TaxID=3016088 RepID=UPI00241756CC|nr:hypothetical protein [Micromonospora sp. WMMD980]MDG4801742.1 hypothetical protein [Micromonospora sp. WMMD980]
MRPPLGCFYCGVEERQHCQLWHPVAGWHGWKEPTRTQIATRLRARLDVPYAVGDQVRILPDPGPNHGSPFAAGGVGVVVSVHVYPPEAGPTLFEVKPLGRASHPYSADRLAPT